MTSKIGITHANHSPSLKAHFDKKCTSNLNVIFFFLHFALDIILDDRCDRKTHTQKKYFFEIKHNYFIEVKPLFSVVEFSITPLLFQEIHGLT